MPVTRHFRLLLAAILPLALVLGGCVRQNPLDFPLEGKFLLFESSYDTALTHVTVMDEAGKIKQTADLLPQKANWISANASSVHVAHEHDNQLLSITAQQASLYEGLQPDPAVGVSALASGDGLSYHTTSAQLGENDQFRSQLEARSDKTGEPLYTVEVPLYAHDIRLADGKLYLVGEGISDHTAVLLIVDAATGRIEKQAEHQTSMLHETFNQVLPLPGVTLVQLGESYTHQGKLIEYRDGQLRPLSLSGKVQLSGEFHLITGDEEEFVYLEGNHLHFAKTADAETIHTIDLGDVEEFNSAQIQDGKLYLFVTGQAKNMNARFRALTIDLETRQQVGEASILIDPKNSFRLGALVPGNVGR